ncbi:hypothetical protein R5R35_009245 [Gryllus longicercus]
MSVMALPREAPYIEGVASAYSLGEWVIANCTSNKTSPQALLSWYINGAKAEQWLLDQMPSAEEEAVGDSVSVSSMGVDAWLQTRAPRTHTVDERGLHTSSLGLRFVAERRFFQGSPARVELRCEAAVGERSWERVVSARLAHANNQQLRSASHRLNSAHLLTSSCSVLSALLACSLLRLLVS